jgi:hypothetical protein
MNLTELETISAAVQMSAEVCSEMLKVKEGVVLVSSLQV